MTKKNWIGTGLVVLTVAGIGYFGLTGKSTKVPQKAFDEMQFGDGFDQVTGDENGIVCHDPILRAGNAPDRHISSHLLIGYDFRTMTPDQKRTAIREHTRKDMEDAGLACVGPGGRPFLSEAFAQKHNPGGSGCNSYSCPAHIQPGGYCDPGGTNCVITFICCGIQCGC